MGTNSMGRAVGTWRGMLFLAGLVLSLLWGWAGAVGADETYLDLQGRSDGLHRLIIGLGLPLLGLWLLLLLLLVLRRLRWVLLPLAMAVFVVLAFLVVRVVAFDRAIEIRGETGQWVPGNPEVLSAYTIRAEALAGAEPSTIVLQEIGQDPLHLAADAWSGPGHLLLDGRAILLVAPDGSPRWSRPRGVLPPASLATDGQVIFLAGGNPDFEDDLLVQAIDVATGRRLWSFHLLGNRALLAQGNHNALELVSIRPSRTRVLLLEPRLRQVLSYATLEGAAPFSGGEE